MKRLATMAVLFLLVLGAGVVGSGGQASAAAQAATPEPSNSCVLLVFCFPSSSSPAPSSSSVPSVPAPSGTLPSGTGASAPTPTTGATAAPNASAAAGATPAAGSPSPTGSASPSPSPSQPKNAAAAPGLVVSNVPWTMTVGSATMNGFVYKGNVNLPLAGGGTIQMMEFTVRSMTMSNAVTRIQENGQTGTETDGSFSAGGVTMYATRLTGDVYGIPIPVTFTPSTVLTQLLKLTNLATGTVLSISMTNVTADQTVILAGQAQKTTVTVTG